MNDVCMACGRSIFTRDTPTAHEVTSDEREALAALIDDIDAGWLMGEARSPYPNELADELIRSGVGFHRSDASVCGHCGGTEWHHTVECFTGEPSDAQEADLIEKGNK